MDAFLTLKNEMVIFAEIDLINRWQAIQRMIIFTSAR